jgi:TIR domain
VQAIDRGPRRRSSADLFLSHSSKDKELALRLATDLSFCGVDSWLDDWEIQIGQSVVDVVAGAMEKARYIAILISDNYNKSVWTKREYKKALAREEQERRVVMLPLLLGNAEIPDFIEDRKYVDLRDQYYSGLAQIAALVHGLSEFRINSAIRRQAPQSMGDIWSLLESVGFQPFVVFGRDDFEEILRHGGESIREDYAYFFPTQLLASAQVSEHVKSLLREVFPRRWYHSIQGGKQVKATQAAQS